MHYDVCQMWDSSRANNDLARAVTNLWATLYNSVSLMFFKSQTINSVYHCRIIQFKKTSTLTLIQSETNEDPFIISCQIWNTPQFRHVGSEMRSNVWFPSPPITSVNLAVDPAPILEHVHVDQRVVCCITWVGACASTQDSSEEPPAVPGYIKRRH